MESPNQVQEESEEVWAQVETLLRKVQRLEASARHHDAMVKTRIAELEESLKVGNERCIRLIGENKKLREEVENLHRSMRDIRRIAEMQTSPSSPDHY